VAPAAGEVHHYPGYRQGPKTLRTLQRTRGLEIRLGHDFDAIIERCQEGRSGWLSDSVVDLYRRVHELGGASAIGAYRDGRLVGGFWGIVVGRTFGVMSMFHSESDAGSLAFAALADVVRVGTPWSMVDLVYPKQHFVRFGAYNVPADKFSELVWRHQPEIPTRMSGAGAPS
jgi:leucyl/phenylalanyl-tRNA--protein transferase